MAEQVSSLSSGGEWRSRVEGAVQGAEQGVRYRVRYRGCGTWVPDMGAGHGCRTDGAGQMVPDRRVRTMRTETFLRAIA